MEQSIQLGPALAIGAGFAEYSQDIVGERIPDDLPREMGLASGGKRRDLFVQLGTRMPSPVEQRGNRPSTGQTRCGAANTGKAAKPRTPLPFRAFADFAESS
jgi:hypothetical protein